MDKVAHSTATEMNFGLRSAKNGRLVRHGRPERRSQNVPAERCPRPGAREHVPASPKPQLRLTNLEHITATHRCWLGDANAVEVRTVTAASVRHRYLAPIVAHDGVAP
jgi:hypothetical protein